MARITVGSTQVKRVILGDGGAGRVLKRVILGDGGAGKVLWQNKPVVVITPGSSAQSQFRSALTARGLSYKTVKELPFDLDTRNATDMRDMFYGCSALTAVPPMDTSNVTDMGFMFYGCAALTTVPPMDTRNVTNMYGMFNNCSALTSVPPMDTRNVTQMPAMFYGCAALRDGNVKLVHPTTTKPAIRGSMIYGSGLTREPFFLPDGTPF